MNTMPTITDLQQRRQRRREGFALHAIEGVSFTAEEKAFVKELDRRGLTDQQRIEAIRARFGKEVEQPLAAE